MRKGEDLEVDGMGSNAARKKPKVVEEVKPLESASESSKKKNKPSARLKTKLTPKQMEQTILEHREHGRRLAWSFLSSWRIRMAQDEVVSVVGAALCEAAIRFDPSKEVAFKTFFFYHLRGMLLKEISRIIQEQKILQFIPNGMVGNDYRGEQLSMAPIIPPLIETNNPEKIIEQKQVAGACWDACAQLDPLEQEVLIRCFVYDEPLVAIAKELKYCRCHISRVKSRALSKLSQLLSDEDVLKERYEDSGIELEKIQLPNAKSSRKKVGYTGGRGRRKRKAEKKRSTILEQLLASSY
jgi:RNA polymerase sigma factor (sigma-70 family)